MTAHGSVGKCYAVGTERQLTDLQAFTTLFTGLALRKGYSHSHVCHLSHRWAQPEAVAEGEQQPLPVSLIRCSAECIHGVVEIVDVLAPVAHQHDGAALTHDQAVGHGVVSCAGRAGHGMAGGRIVSGRLEGGGLSNPTV